MTQKPEKAKIVVALEPGDYIVSVNQGFRRVWKHQGNGLFVGHGGKIRRPTIADGIRDLTISAEKHEGMDDQWGTCPNCGSPKFRLGSVRRLVSPQIPDCSTVELTCHCFDCGHEVKRIEG